MQSDTINLPRQSTRYESIYQFRGTIAATQSVAAMSRVTATIMDFFEDHFKTQWPEDIDYEQDFVIDNDTRLNAEAVIVRERGIWALRLKYYNDIDCSGRWFYHDVALVSEEDELAFGYSVYAEIHGKEFPIFVPHLIYHLSDTCNLYQFRKIDGGFLNIASPMQLEELWCLAIMPERTLPLVVISELSTRQRSVGGKIEHFTVEPTVVVARLRGFAHVVQLAYDASREWCQRVGRAFCAVEGGVRIMLPGFNPENDLASDHPGHFRDSILEYQYRDKVGVEAYMMYLFHATRRMTDKPSETNERVYFLPDAKRLQKEFEHFFNWIDRAAAVNEKRLRIEADALKSNLHKAEAEISQKNDEITEANRQSIYWQEQAVALQKSIELLSGHRIANKSVVQTSFPSEYPAVAKWAEQQFSGKLLLLPQAVKSLERGCYFSLELVCRGLELLANEYRDAQMSNDSTPLTAVCKKHGLTIRRASGKAKISQDSNWYVNYPEGNDVRRFLEYKIERGFGKSPRHVLRIYFFYDSDNSLVVVGHLPSQLES